MAMSEQEVAELMSARAQFGKNREVLETILDAAKAVDVAITGFTDVAPRPFQGAVLFTSVIAQAINLLKILPEPNGDRQLYDLTSTSVLVRAIGESYLAFRYMAMEPVEEYDFEFRSTLSAYHARLKQRLMIKALNVDDARQGEAETGYHESKKQLTENRFFKGLSPDPKSALLGGKEKHRSNEMIAEQSGLFRGAWTATYTMLSQYAHATPFAQERLRNFSADSPIANSQMGLLCQLAAGFLACMIEDMLQLFPSSGDGLTENHRKWTEIQLKVIREFGRNMAKNS